MDTRKNHGYPPGWHPIQVFVPYEVKMDLQLLAIREGVRPALIIRRAIKAELARCAPCATIEGGSA